MDNKIKDIAIYNAIAGEARNFFDNIIVNEAGRYTAAQLAKNKGNNCTFIWGCDDNDFANEVVNVEVERFTMSFPRSRCFDVMAMYEATCKIGAKNRITFSPCAKGETVGMFEMNIPKCAKDLINCVSTDNLRPMMMYIYIDVEAATLVASDTKVLKTCKVELSEVVGELPESLFISPAQLKQLAGKQCIVSLNRVGPADNVKWLTVIECEGNTFDNDIHGTFPAWKRLIPKEKYCNGFHLMPDAAKQLAKFVKASKKSYNKLVLSSTIGANFVEVTAANDADSSVNRSISLALATPSEITGAMCFTSEAMNKVLCNGKSIIAYEQNTPALILGDVDGVNSLIMPMYYNGNWELSESAQARRPITPTREEEKFIKRSYETALKCERGYVLVYSGVGRNFISWSDGDAGKGEIDVTFTRDAAGVLSVVECESHDVVRVDLNKPQPEPTQQEIDYIRHCYSEKYDADIVEVAQWEREKAVISCCRETLAGPVWHEVGVTFSRDDNGTLAVAENVEPYNVIRVDLNADNSQESETVENFTPETATANSAPENKPDVVPVSVECVADSVAPDVTPAPVHEVDIYELMRGDRVNMLIAYANKPANERGFKEMNVVIYNRDLDMYCCVVTQTIDGNTTFIHLKEFGTHWQAMQYFGMSEDDFEYNKINILELRRNLAKLETCPEHSEIEETEVVPADVADGDAGSVCVVDDLIVGSLHGDVVRVGDVAPVESAGGRDAPPKIPDVATAKIKPVVHIFPPGSIVYHARARIALQRNETANVGYFRGVNAPPGLTGPLAPTNIIGRGRRISQRPANVGSATTGITTTTGPPDE